jgi:hypothetical protein
MVHFQGVAQPGSAPGPEPGGRRFESCRPDHFAPTQTVGGDHATRRLRRTAILSKPRASGGGGYASETQVRRGDRVVHGDKELIERLGRNDLCPCGSGRRFQEMLPAFRPFRRQRAELLFPSVALATGRTAPRCSLGSGAIGGAADSDSAGCRFDPCLPNHPASRYVLRRSATREVGCPPKPWRRRASYNCPRSSVDRAPGSGPGLARVRILPRAPESWPSGKASRC